MRERVMTCCAAIFGLMAGVFALPAPAAQDAHVPDLSGMWGRNIFNFGEPESGQGPVAGLKRLPNGATDPANPVGDYLNPILKPEAARIVRERGEVVLSGKTFPSPSTECALYPVPYALSMLLQLEILQKADEVLVLSMQDQSVRRIRLNEAHQRPPVPSWRGDPVGHYEGDTLVVDTVGFKVGPLSMVDRYGTPHSDKLHLIERFRLIDARAARLAVQRDERVNVRGRAVDVDQGYGKGIKVDFTVEDTDVFTRPWSASVTYQRVKNEWQEYVCAENIHVYYDKDTAVPQTDRSDF